MLSVLFLIAVLLGCIPLHLSHLVICTCVRQPCCSKYMLHTNLVNTHRIILIYIPITGISRSQWPSGLRRGFAAARLLGLRVWITLGAWMSFSCECCVLSVRVPYVELITSPEESYRVWWVWEWSWSLDNGEFRPIGVVAPWKTCRQQGYNSKSWVCYISGTLVIIQTFVLANETEKAKRTLLYGTVHYIISRNICMWWKFKLFWYNQKFFL